MKDVEDFDQSQRSLKLSFLESQPLRMATLGAALYERVQLTRKAHERGQLLAKELRPILKRGVDLRVNIAHAYGIARCNEVIASKFQYLEQLESVQANLIAEQQATITQPPTSNGSRESELNRDQSEHPLVRL